LVALYGNESDKPIVGVSLKSLAPLRLQWKGLKLKIATIMLILMFLSTKLVKSKQLKKRKSPEKLKQIKFIRMFRIYPVITAKAKFATWLIELDKRNWTMPHLEQ
jgi:hypothetical protein